MQEMQISIRKPMPWKEDASLMAVGSNPLSQQRISFTDITVEVH